MNFKPKESEISPQLPDRKLISRGDLIDSLDLNIGYESIQKLKDNWFNGLKVTKEKFK